MEKRYTVTQASQMLNVKSNVLRYWEEELDLRIRRNEQGHRYYTDTDIGLFSNIKELKNRGLQLRAIKELIPRICRTVSDDQDSKIRLLPVRPQSEELQEVYSYENRMMEFQRILERLINQEIQMKRDGETRCRELDAAIRRQQLMRREAAAAGMKKSRSR